MTNNPIIDGYVLPEEPFATCASGRQNEVPLLTGSNAGEGGPLIAGRNVRPATFVEDIGEAFGSNVVREMAEEYLTIYPATTDKVTHE